jgi:hypothetical protein
MWKNVIEQDRPQMAIWRTRFACWIPKATDSHTEQLMRIAFPRRWLRERVSMLRYTYIASLFCSGYQRPIRSRSIEIGTKQTPHDSSGTILLLTRSVCRLIRHNRIK